MFTLKEDLKNLNFLVKLTANGFESFHLHLLFFNFGLSLFESFFQGRGPVYIPLRATACVALEG